MMFFTLIFAVLLFISYIGGKLIKVALFLVYNLQKSPITVIIGLEDEKTNLSYERIFQQSGFYSKVSNKVIMKCSQIKFLTSTLK